MEFLYLNRALAQVGNFQKPMYWTSPSPDTTGRLAPGTMVANTHGLLNQTWQVPTSFIAP